MKRSQLEAKIKQAALREIPDITKNIHLKQINIPPRKEKEHLFLKHFNYKIGIIAFSLVTVSVLGFFMFFNPSNTLNHLPLSNDDEIIEFQIVSAASFLDNSNIVSLSMELSQSMETSLLDDQLEYVNQDMNSLEEILGDQETISYQVLSSDLSQYEFAYRYINIDFLDQLIEYKIYYNITKDLNGNDIMEGIVVHEGLENSFSATLSQSNQRLSNLMISSTDGASITINDISTEEYQQFELNLFNNNEMVKQTKIRVYSKNNHLSAVIDSTMDDFNYELDVEKINNKESKMFTVSYQYQCGMQMDSGEFNVSVESSNTGETHYMYEMKSNSSMMSSYHASRSSKGSTKASDDDFNGSSGNGNSGNKNGNGSSKSNAIYEENKKII